jgi:hypothetical protein
MESWWEGITTLNKAFAVSTAVFTLFFLWQLIMTLWGVDSSGAHHGDMAAHSGTDAPGHYGDHDVGGEAFTLISIRSILAFATLFSWAGTLYLSSGTHILWAILYSLLWGAAAMVGVSVIFHFMLSMQESGNISLWWAIGEEGTVYLNIPAGGTGKVRIMVKGVMSIISAGTRDGLPLNEGTKIKVVDVVNQNTIEVIAL